MNIRNVIQIFSEGVINKLQSSVLFTFSKVFITVVCPKSMPLYVGGCVGFVMCVCVCMCGFCNVWVCACVGFVMCGCVYVWVV
jgi:hypothetical protein